MIEKSTVGREGGRKLRGRKQGMMERRRGGREEGRKKT
jgi:hypothetical protein